MNLIPVKPRGGDEAGNKNHYLTKRSTLHT